MDNSLISVIIPCYNVQEYISECIDSVLGQNYNNIEIICVDDGSSDNTWRILQKRQKEFPQIKIYKQQNKGAPAARNKGLSVAKGTYIQFLDADDLILPAKLMHQLNLAESENADLIAGNYIRIFSDGRQEKRNVEQDVFSGIIKGKLGITSSNLYKKEMVLQVNTWNENIESSQEYDLMFRLYKRGSKIIADLEYLSEVYERKSGDSISQLNRAASWERYILLRKEIKEYIEENKSLKKYWDEINQELFNAIRILAKYNQKKATEFHKLLIKGKYHPKAGGATSNKYLLMYKYLGFELTEKMKRVFNSRLPIKN